jgi:hypothetical protein
MNKRPNCILVSSLLVAALCSLALALSASLPGGWWFGAQVQNVSSTQASVTYTIYDFASGTYSLSDSIAPGASKNYGLTDFNLADNFQGSSKANPAQDIRVIVNLTNRGITVNGTIFGDYDSPSPAAGQYQGMGSGATTLRFPLVKNDHYDNSTTIIVQNAGTGPATATTSFTFGTTTYNYTTPTINPGQMAVVGPIDARTGSYPYYLPPSDQWGWLFDRHLLPAFAGIALEHLTGEDHATVLQATRGFTDSVANATLYAPINKNYRYNRFTGLQVQNVGQYSVNIMVTYFYNQDSRCTSSGSINDSKSNVAPGASVTFSSSVFPTGCFASTKIVATGNSPLIVGIVNESFTGQYIATHPGHAQEATAYAAIPQSPFINHHILSVPLFKEDSYSKATGVSVQNIGSQPAHLVATFKNSSQTFITNYIIINPNQAIVLQDMRLLDSNPPSWWRGWDTSGGKPAMNPTTLGCNANGCGANGVFSVILNSINNYPIVAVANESTYPIDAPRINQDKSNYEAFSLTAVP